MLIKLDVRERDLHQKCEAILSSSTTAAQWKDLRLVVEPLPLGDVVLCTDDGLDLVLLERKSVADLAASITDGRYEEQSYRLSGLDHPNHNIVYLIEGDLFRAKNLPQRMNNLTLYSAMTSVCFFKGFSVLRTSCLDETALVLCAMANKLHKNARLGKPLYFSGNKRKRQDSPLLEEGADKVSEPTNEPTDTFAAQPYCSVVKKIKKDNVSPENIGEIMLCQIPHVGSTAAIAIMQKFQSIAQLINALQTDDHCLDDVCTTDPAGKSRKLSRAVVSNIKNYLLPNVSA